MIDFSVPSKAFSAFEETYALRLTLHDLMGSLWPFVPLQRLAHSHPCCTAVKNSQHLPVCMHFDLSELRAQLPRAPEGCYRVCHAGLVEWVTPVFSGTELEWVLFAGVRSAGEDLDAYRAPRTRWSLPPWRPHAATPPPVDTAEAERILEGLRQLAARLVAWSDAHRRQVVDAPAEHTIASEPATIRRTLIYRFIQARHTSPDIRLSDLANELGLSEDRAGRVVQKACGVPFRQLLIDARLSTATSLLRSTSLPVLEIAHRSGFTEAAHFTRIFRRRLKTSPGRYRRGQCT